MNELENWEQRFGTMKVQEIDIRKDHIIVPILCLSGSIFVEFYQFYDKMSTSNEYLRICKLDYMHLLSV